MAARNILVAVLLAVLLASSAPYSVPAQAQMGAACAAELNRADSEFKAFAGEVKDTSLDAVSTDVVGQKLSDVKTALAGKPDQVALEKLKDLKTTLFDYAEDLMTMEGTMRALVGCLNSGPPGCLLEIVKQQGEAFARWQQRLSDLGKNAAVDRVNQAGRLVHGYATKALSMATDNATRGLKACETEIEKAIQAEKDAVNTPDNTPPDPAGGVGTPKKSGGMGKAVIGASVAAAGAIAAGVALGKVAQKVSESNTGGSSSGGSSGSAGSMTYVSPASINCTFNSGGIVNSCANTTIRVNITKSINAGSRLKLLTNHIQSSLFTTTVNPPGTVTFTGFSGGGWFDQCGPPVTRLDLINTSVDSSAIVASVSGLSLPVTCR